jgi:peptidoglycan hydrolase-like protein with peptidoglycan-binding domain
MNQHGDFPAPAEGVRSEIADILSKNGLMNPKGKIDLKKLDLVQSPERKRMLQSLVNMQRALQENPSVRSLNALKQDLQSLANYGAPIRTAEQVTFGKLAEHAKSAVDDALSQAAGSEAGEFQAVLKKYAQQKPTLDALSTTATRLPERLVVNARVQFPKSKVQELLKTNPEFKDDIGNFVFEHITQTPASQNTIRKTMDYYGRDFLKDLVGEKRFKLLQQVEEQLTSASAKFTPKNFPNQEYQRRIGEILGPDELGPYSPDFAKKTISRKDAEAAAKLDFEIKELKKQLTKKFEFQDPNMLKIQELLNKLLGKPTKNSGSFGDALVEAVPPILINRRNQ